MADEPMIGFNKLKQSVELKYLIFNILGCLFQLSILYFEPFVNQAFFYGIC